MTALLGGLPVDVPVTPDGPEAQRWLIDELAKSAYQSARPGPFDEFVKQIQDWLNSLIDSLGSVKIAGVGNLLPAILVGAIVVVLVVAFLVFGVPRLNRRSAAGGELFDDDDSRDSEAMRRDAERAAASGDFTTAIEELFRALARGLDERTLVSFFPGSTARGVAARAGGVFPDAAERLLAAARTFDDVRYLGVVGSAPEWQSLVALERELRTTRPPHDPADADSEAGAGAESLAVPQ